MYEQGLATLQLGRNVFDQSEAILPTLILGAKFVCKEIYSNVVFRLNLV